jgi:hypothetical protein
MPFELAALSTITNLLGDEKYSDYCTGACKTYCPAKINTQQKKCQNVTSSFPAAAAVSHLSKELDLKKKNAGPS